MDKSISDIINGIKEKELKDFLIQLLQEDEKIYDRFRMHFISEFPKPSISNYKSKIRKAISEVAGRDDYIDYYSGQDYVYAMYKFTHEADSFIQNAEYELAFDIVRLILDEIPDLDIDGSNGETEDVANECIEIIEKILELCNDEKVIKKILKYVSEEIITESLSNYGIELYQLISIFIQKQLYLPEIENTLLSAIEKGKEKKYFHQQDYYVTLLVDIYESTNQNNKIFDVMKDNLDDHNVLLKYVDILIEQKDYKTAIELLKKGIKKDFSEYRGIVIKLSNKLISIYEGQKMTKEYEAELYELFFNYDKYDLDVFKKIKKLYSSKKWPYEFANILKRIDEKDKTSVYSKVMQIYVEEKMIDEIFNLVKDCYDFDIIRKYEEYLISKYKNEVIEFYFSVIKNEARRSSNRTHYRELAHKLMYVKKIAKEKTEFLVMELVNEYRNRPAMIDELQKMNAYQSQ